METKVFVRRNMGYVKVYINSIHTIQEIYFL